MKIIIVLGALGAAAWYYFIGGAKLDEAMVRQFYADQSHAVLSRDPELLCKLYAGNMKVTQETSLMGQVSTQTFDQKQACNAQREAFKMFAAVGDKVDGILMIDYEYQVGKIEIAPNHKSARVELTSRFDMGNGIYAQRIESSETLVREWGKVLLVQSDSKAKVRMNVGAMADPAKYLKPQ
jgi:hypothetical protein